MRSLISRFIMRRISMAAMLVIATFAIPAAAVDGFGQTFLEEPSIVAVGKEGEIHIRFSSEVRYVRHFPERSGDVLHISLEVVDPCVAEDLVTQETKWLPPADWYPAATLTFPESIRRSTTGPALCRGTHNQVYVGHNLSLKFGKATEFKVRPGGDGRSIVVSVPLLKQPAAPKVQTKVAAPTPPVQAAPEAVPTVTAKQPEPVAVQTPEPVKTAPELPAVDLLVAGRAALSAGDAPNAVQLLNRLLNLPPNDYSQEAQELVGVAREKMDEIDKARAEYQLYLRLYPTGEGAERVKQRLAALEAPKAQPKKTREVQAKPKKAVREVHQNTFTGSISQYYYAGKTQSTSTNGAGEVDQRRSTDQSTLITNVDATGRFRHNQYDTRIVFRDTQVHNALPGRADKNTLSTAYVEHQNKLDDYMFRIGRQSGTTQGVLGRFDGVFARYGLNSQWRITAVAGQPDNGSRSSVKTDRHFYGMGVEFGPLAEKWSGTVYGIQQVADGLVERRAVGTEMRYFNGTTSWFGLVDYDTIYSAVNIAMLQGNWTAEGGYNFNLLLDHRKSPILYGETAIQGLSGARSVSDLRLMLSSGNIYSFVKGLVPESDMAMFGVTKQVTDRWQVGGDIRATHIGSTDGAGAVAAQPGINDNYTLTLQAIGTNTLFKNDTSVIMASFVEDPQYNAQNLSFSNSLMLQEKWRVDSAIRYYQEERDAGQKTWKVNPTVRLNYHWRENMSFEAELNIDRTYTDDPVAVTKTTTWRETLFAGYRWDFR